MKQLGEQVDLETANFGSTVLDDGYRPDCGRQNRSGELWWCRSIAETNNLGLLRFASVRTSNRTMSCGTSWQLLRAGSASSSHPDGRPTISSSSELFIFLSKYCKLNTPFSFRFTLDMHWIMQKKRYKNSSHLFFFAFACTESVTYDQPSEPRFTAWRHKKPSLVTECCL